MGSGGQRGEHAERRLGRGLEDFSHLFFSAAEERRNEERRAKDRAGEERRTDRVDAREPLGEPGARSGSVGEAPQSSRPRTLFVTGFRRGTGKTFVATAIAESCRKLGVSTAEWQLGPGVVVPRVGERFDRPMPHPADRASFDRLIAGAGRRSVLILDGPVSLLTDGDPFAHAVEEFVVIALPGPEGAAEGYAAVKEIVTSLPAAAVRVAVNRAASQGEAREVFHLIADVSERFLGRTVRSYGGLPSFLANEICAAQGGLPGRTLLFQRIARSLAGAAREVSTRPSYFEEVWTRLRAVRA